MVRLRTVRARATIGAVLVVGSALLIASGVLLVVLRRAYVDAARQPAQHRADDLVAALERGLTTDDLQLDEGEDRFIQVVRAGEVLAASENARGAGPLSMAAGIGVSVSVGDPDDEWVVVVRATSDGREVVVGRELDPPFESVSTAAAAMALGVPLLVLVVGATTWRVTGSALGPVEGIRAEVESITASDLDRRVPVPSSQDEIDDLAETMNRMLDRLSTAQRRERQFVSDASHELRSPVAAIRQHAEVARAHPSRSDVAALADAVLAEEQRLEALIDDLLLLSRAAEGFGRPHRALDLDDLALDEAQHVRASGAVSVETDGVGPAQITGDERLLRRALRNVIDNAARHASSRVRLIVRADAGGAVVEVHDDGPGIPAEHRAEVFGRFVRLDESRSTATGGAGLGLAIVAEVVGSHGGSVSIDDSPLGGAVVRVELPAL